MAVGSKTLIFHMVYIFWSLGFSYMFWSKKNQESYKPGLLGFNLSKPSWLRELSESGILRNQPVPFCGNQNLVEAVITMPTSGEGERLDFLHFVPAIGEFTRWWF